MHRVLKPGGTICLMVPDWQTQYKIFYEDPTHIHPYTVKSMDRLLNMMDFKEVHSEKFVQLPSTWNGGISAFMSSILRFLHGVIRGDSVPRVYKNKFVRFSLELMVLADGKK